MNAGCFSETELAIVASLPPTSEFRDVPLRDEPDKYLYISTAEEKKAAGVVQAGDECWVFRRAWAGGHLDIGRPYLSPWKNAGVWEVEVERNDGCHYRRPKANL